VAAARTLQLERGTAAGLFAGDGLNARIDGRVLERIGTPDEPGHALLFRAAESGALTARGWGRVLRLARTIADFYGSTGVRRRHIAASLGYRRARFDPPRATDGSVGTDI
jgi:magnesium chelatase family protein